MARLEDISPGEREMIRQMELPRFEATPLVDGPPLARRRVAILSTAALITRTDERMGFATTDYRVIPSDVAPNDIMMSHGSVNFDRSGFQQDYNVCFPLDRLRELAADGVIGSIGRFHYTVVGGHAPAVLEGAARDIARQMKQDSVDLALLVPV